MTYAPTQSVGITTDHLFHLLKTCRPHKGKGEKATIKWISSSLAGYGTHTVDSIGNLHIDTRLVPTNRTMFTCHVDTCDHVDGKKRITYDSKSGMVSLHKSSKTKGNVLGADDGAGVYVLMHMIAAGIPGYYCFFIGEERGGVGSSWLAKNQPDLLREFDHAIAFDRGHTTDIITHQGGTRCCSDAFAQELADRMFDVGLMPDNSGVYTDTAEFIDIIPECTNISVGYEKQHGCDETLDLRYLDRLINCVLTMSWYALPVERDPKVYESLYERLDWGNQYAGGVTHWSDTYGADLADDLADKLSILLDLVDTHLPRSIGTRQRDEALKALEAYYDSVWQ